MNIEVRRIANTLEPAKYFAYIKEVDIVKESIGEERLELLLQVPLDNCEVAYLKTKIPVISNGVEELCMSTSIKDGYPEYGFDIKNLLDEICLIEVVHQYHFCDRKTVVNEFLSFDCRHKDMNIRNAKSFPEYMISQ